MSGLVYCHICKCEAFPKTSFGSVISLDCGHVARKDGQSFSRTKRESSGVKKVEAPAPYVQKERPVEKRTFTEVPKPPQEPYRPSRSVSGTHNIANAIRDLIDK